MPTEITAEENHAAQINAEIRTIDLTSNSSSKYNGLIPLICSLTGLPNAEIHITAASMASNVEGRLRNGKHQNKHYQLCVLIVSNSQLGNAVEQAKGHIDNARSGYFNTIVFMQPNGNNGDWIVSSIVTNSDGRTIAMRIKNEYNLANVLEIGNATAQQSMQQSFFGTIGAGKVYLDLEEMFRAWLPSHGVNDETAKGYVSHLKAVSEPCAPHPPKGAWLGFFEDLTGCSPEKKVYEISSLNEFDRVYKKLGDFFNQDEPSAEGFNQGMYSACYNYAKTSSDGDQGKTRNGFVKYREFLSDPFIKKIISLQIYLSAIRTKPFVLLAGISGTGKTRLVRQLARGCCHEPKLISEETNTCGNYECIPVRPNWHDSTELLGYVTRITKNDEPPKYVLTPFVEFLAKAWTYREVPFFLCLDEMNLAPVEQYFAEYLSVVESRDWITIGDGENAFKCLSSREKLVRVDSLEKETKDELLKELFDSKDWANSAQHGRVQQVKEMFEKDQGIRLPPNLVVMGTVNMDETTCSFSRKVLDRAMSFELNDVSDMYAPANLEGEGDCKFGLIDAKAAQCTLLTGKDAYNSAGGQGVAVASSGKNVSDAILDFLKILNEDEVPAKKEDGTDGSGNMFLLAKTPFKIAYRSRNEIMIYCIERIAGGLVSLPQALDEAVSMKVLSRIEGDSQHVKPEWLQTLSAAIVDGLSKLDGYDAAKCIVCKEKLADMTEQAKYGYTSFWM